jgi:hypothetical protein
MSRIQLGAHVEDRITGFKGIVTGYVQYLTGCNQALIVPRIDEKGAMVDSAWIDEQRLIVGDEPRVSLENGANPGADRAPPKR